jgi:hypothetical protein
MIEQMKQMRLNRTALYSTGQSSKPSSVLALSEENKKAQNSNLNFYSSSPKAENLIYKVNKNQLMMKQTSGADAELVRLAKKPAKKTAQP